MNRWVFFTRKYVQFENVSFFIKVLDEEKFLLFQHGEINGKSAMLSYWFAWCNQNWAIEVCKWSVAITIC